MVDWSGLKEGGEAGVGRLRVPGAVQNVRQKHHPERAKLVCVFVCSCRAPKASMICLLTGFMIAGPYHY